MNWDQVEGSWTEWQGKAKQKWGKLTDDELTQAKGKKDEVAGLLQKKYGYAKEEAHKQLDEFMNEK